MSKSSAKTSATPRVTRAIRELVWPVLRAHGFDGFTGRSAWRGRADTVDVVNFQAAVGHAGFPLLLATPPGGAREEASLGSFSVNAGTYYTLRRVLPWKISVYARPVDEERPPEHQCDQRRDLQKATRRD